MAALGERGFLIARGAPTTSAKPARYCKRFPVITARTNNPPRGSESKKKKNKPHRHQK